MVIDHGNHRGNTIGNTFGKHLGDNFGHGNRHIGNLGLVDRHGNTSGYGNQYGNHWLHFW